MNEDFMDIKRESWLILECTVTHLDYSNRKPYLVTPELEPYIKSDVTTLPAS